MAESTEGADDKKKLYWIVGGAVFAVFLAIAAFLLMRKPAPKTYTKGNAGKPDQDSPGASIIDTIASTVQKVVKTNRSTPLKEGSTGTEVSALQEDLGSLGNGITVDGTWGAETTKALGDQYAAWKEDPQWTISLEQFEALMDKHKPVTAQEQVDNPIPDVSGIPQA